MYKNFETHQPYFQGVAMATIILGAAFFTFGGIEWICNFFGQYGFANPSAKMIGGAVVTSLGYIHLELELMRIQAGKKRGETWGDSLKGK